MNSDQYRETFLIKPEIVGSFEKETGWSILCTAQDDMYTDSSLCKDYIRRDYPGMLLDTAYAGVDYTTKETGWSILCGLQEDLYTDSSLGKKNSGRHFTGMQPDTTARDYSGAVTGWSILCDLEDEETLEKDHRFLSGDKKGTNNILIPDLCPRIRNRKRGAVC